MALHSDTESGDQLRKEDASDDSLQIYIDKMRKLLASKSQPCISTDKGISHTLSLKNVLFSQPPSREICELVAKTFKKMDIQSLGALKNLNEELRLNGCLNKDDLIIFTTRIMSETWKCDKEMTDLLIADTNLTQIIGKEFLVLFDNVLFDPIYETTKYGNIQRYAKSCLDNSILPVFEDIVPEQYLETCETVLSTYTSPKAFTPEMELLLKRAESLGISTNGLTLNIFVTERSLSAYLNAVIEARTKKKTFKYSFSKLCQNSKDSRKSKYSTIEGQYSTISTFTNESESSIEHMREKSSDTISTFGGTSNDSDSGEQESGFSLLAEQKSFFRLGDGARRDALSQFVEDRDTSKIRKKVQWLDQKSDAYFSIKDSRSDVKMFTNIKQNPTRNDVKIFISNFIDLLDPSYVRRLENEPQVKVMAHAFIQANVLAAIFWIFYLLC